MSEIRVTPTEAGIRNFPGRITAGKIYEVLETDSVKYMNSKIYVVVDDNGKRSPWHSDYFIETDKLAIEACYGH